MRKRHAISTILIVLLTACGGDAKGVLPPIDVGASPRPELTLVWVGQGQTERFEHGAWQRAETFDYEFTVEQRRYPDRWESVKHLRRRHPGYDGSAGPREQTMFFRLDLAAADPQGNVALGIQSSLGDGHGQTDRGFRRASFVLNADVGRFAPFDTYRIAQRYEYERGMLIEQVSLDKGDAPWVRNQESATLFAPHRFTEPPTTR